MSRTTVSCNHLLTLVILLCVVMMVLGGKPNSTPANDASLINRINSKSNGWKAKAYKLFNGKTIGDVKKMVIALDDSMKAHFKDILDGIKQKQGQEKDDKSSVAPENGKSESGTNNNDSSEKKKGKKASKPSSATSKNNKNNKKGSRKSANKSSQKLSNKKPPKTRKATSKQQNSRNVASPKRKSAPKKKTSSSPTRKIASSPATKKTLKRRPRMSSGVATLASGGGGSGGKIPASFDARQKWPQCQPFIKQQLECGSCYAFTATGALAHRFCVATRGKVYPDLSPDYMVRCNTGTKACEGGKNIPTWQFLETTGVPTNQCVMYRSGYNYVQECPAVCDDGSPLQFYKSATGSLTKLEGDDAIKRSIMTEGSVHSVMVLLRDFINYEGGIYKKNSDTVIGAHAVQLIGWGQENGQEYWIGVNSWGTWGEGGYFRIANGEVGIGRLTHAGKPQL